VGKSTIGKRMDGERKCEYLAFTVGSVEKSTIGKRMDGEQKGEYLTFYCGKIYYREENGL
jgi:hypothetical protein